MIEGGILANMFTLMDVFKKYDIEPKRFCPVEIIPGIDINMIYTPPKATGFLCIDYFNGVIPRKSSIETNSSDQ